MSAPEAVRLESVGHSYGETRALEGVSLSIRRGEMFGLVGPDGAGKTTLLRVLAAVITPEEGAVEWSEVSERGYLSQGFSLYQDLTVDENIDFFAEIHGVRDFKERSRELLSFVGLLPFRKRLAGRLSGGMKKKLALACAMVHRPEVLLLDEPTTGVDPVSRRDFWLLLVELLREGITIIISTPYLDEAERCMRVGLLKNGRFLSVDTPDAVKARVGGAIYEVVSPRQRDAYRVLSEDGGYAPQQLQPLGDSLHVLGATDEAEIRSLLEGRRVPFESVRTVPPSLENAFISLVREGGEQ